MGTVFNHLPASQLKLVIGEWVWEHHGHKRDDSQDTSHEHPEDPHIWMDVSLWAEAPAAISDTLATMQPSNKEAFLSRAEELRKRLLALDQYGRKLIDTIPEKQRVLITSHDAFQYFGKRYNIEVRGVQGMSTESEAGLATISELVNMIVDREIPTIFVESSVSSNTMRALVEGCAARGKQIELGGPLFSDALGPSGTYEGTYIGMMDHNFKVITKGLGGNVANNRFESGARSVSDVSGVTKTER
jgi:manganese/zinc/iron transport system substrate-binding protein